MKRPTRVPASMVVRMKSASNMIAKWYQSAIHPWPNALANMWAMPSAKVGAPPVRPKHRLFADLGGDPVHLGHRHREAGRRDGRDHLAGAGSCSCRR